MTARQQIVTPIGPVIAVVMFFMNVFILSNSWAKLGSVIARNVNADKKQIGKICIAAEESKRAVILVSSLNRFG